MKQIAASLFWLFTPVVAFGCDDSPLAVEADVEERGPTDAPSEVGDQHRRADQVSAPSERDDEDASCGGGGERPVRFGWPGTGNNEPKVITSGRALPFEITNVTTQTRSFDIVAVVDSGTLQGTTTVIDHVAVGPNDTERRSLDLRRAGVQFDRLQFSGAAHLSAVDTEHGTTTVSEPVYFHVDGKALLAYGEDLLLRKFHAGDFSNSLQLEEEPGVLTTRIVSAEDAIRSTDDRLEDAIRPELEDVLAQEMSDDPA